MKQFLKEIDENFGRFSASWQGELGTVVGALQAYQRQYSESYRRIVSLQAWRANLLEGRINPSSLEFFVEAQNDALVSHVLARLGSWRSALKSLRSCIENVCYCLYYMDHPVELELWRSGQHTLSFAGVTEYLERHPAVRPVQRSTTGVELVRREYSVLSRAVHASAAGFRMTADGTGVRLWFSEKARVGSWLTREVQTLAGINLLLLTIFRDELQGTRASGLRKAVSLAVPSSCHTEIKQKLGVTLLMV